MKVVERTRSDKAIERMDYRSSLEIEIDGKVEFSVSDGEPEDSNLNRDFSDCHSITSLMQKAWEAGKNGDSFDIDYEEDDDI